MTEIFALKKSKDFSALFPTPSLSLPHSPSLHFLRLAEEATAARALLTLSQERSATFLIFPPRTRRHDNALNFAWAHDDDDVGNLEDENGAARWKYNGGSKRERERAWRDAVANNGRIISSYNSPLLINRVTTAGRICGRNRVEPRRLDLNERFSTRGKPRTEN